MRNIVQTILTVYQWNQNYEINKDLKIRCYYLQSGVQYVRGAHIHFPILSDAYFMAFLLFVVSLLNGKSVFRLSPVSSVPSVFLYSFADTAMSSYAIHCSTPFYCIVALFSCTVHTRTHQRKCFHCFRWDKLKTKTKATLEL